MTTKSIILAKLTGMLSATSPAEWKLWVFVGFGALLIMGSSVLGQALPAAEAKASAGVFLSFGGMRTHVEAFDFNALGLDAGAYFQPYGFAGVEVRGGTYPFHARFVQTPFTAGFRFGPREVRPGHWMISGYFGGGMSKAQDAGPHYVATPAAWSPCWQASQSLDIPLGRFRWKVYEATWTETYTQLRNLGAISAGTGLVYTFR